MTKEKTSRLSGKLASLRNKKNTSNIAPMRAFFATHFAPKHVIEFLILAIVFLLPLQTRLIFHESFANGFPYEYGTTSLYITDILIITAVVLTLLFWDRVVTPETWSRVRPAIGSAWIFVGFCFMTIIFAEVPKVTLFWIWNLCLMVALFSVIAVTQPSRLRILWALVVMGTLQAGVAITEWYAQMVPASTWLGMSLQLPATHGVQIIDTASHGRVLRAYGTLPHPNILAGYFIVSIVSAIELLRVTRFREIRRDRSLIYGHGYETVLFAALLLMGAGLWTTASRGAYLALMVALTVWLVAGIWSTKKRRAQHTTPATLEAAAKKPLHPRAALKNIFTHPLAVRIIIALATPLFLLSVVYPWFVTPRVEVAVDSKNAAPLEQRSINERSQYIQESVVLIKRNWATGIGYQNYTQHKDTPVHNVYLLALAEVGIFGVLAFIGFAAQYAFTLFQTHPQDRKKSHLVFRQSILLPLALITSLAVIGLVDHYLYSLHPGMLLFWALAGIALIQLPKQTS